METGTTSRVSVATGGAQASGDSLEVAWGSRAPSMVYESAAANLAPDDSNGVNDAFIIDLAEPFITYGYDRLYRLTSVTDPAADRCHSLLRSPRNGERGGSDPIGSTRPTCDPSAGAGRGRTDSR